MRHYDNNNNEILKLVFTFYAGIITLSLGVYEFIYQKNPNENISLLYISLILAFSFIIGIIVIILVVSNRKYFVKVAQQVNAIRNYYFKKIKSIDNKLPVDDNLPKTYNLKSSQMIVIFLLVFINSLVFFFACSSMFQYLFNSHFYIASLVVNLLYLSLSFLVIIKYLKKWLNK